MANKLTKNQLLVLETLRKEQAPLSAYTILDRLRDKGLRAPLQIYRALEKLIEAQQVHKLESVNAFMACNHPHGCNHGLTAFAICDHCGNVNELEDHSLAHDIQHMTQTIGFSAQHSTVEIHGRCANCMKR